MVKKNWKTTWKNIALGVMMLVFSASVISAMVAVMVWNEVLPEQGAKIAVQAATVLVVYVVCWLLSKRTGKGKMQAACGIAGCYLLVCIGMKMVIFSDDVMNLDLWAVVTVLSGVLGGLTAGMKRQYRR